MCTSAHFYCEASLIQGRLQLQHWAQGYLLDKVSSGWHHFTRKDTTANGSPLPRYQDISEACGLVLEKLSQMMNVPSEVSLLVTFKSKGAWSIVLQQRMDDPINSLLAQMTLAFYYDKSESLAYQAFKLEKKFPGILGTTGMRPFFDTFPITIWAVMETAVSSYISWITINIKLGNRCFLSLGSSTLYWIIFLTRNSWTRLHSLNSSIYLILKMLLILKGTVNSIYNSLGASSRTPPKWTRSCCIWVTKDISGGTSVIYIVTLS